jgi:hypothetical protein
LYGTKRCQTGQKGEGGEEKVEAVCVDIYRERQTQAHASKQFTLTFTWLPLTATAAPQWHGSDRQQDVSDPAQRKIGVSNPGDNSINVSRGEIF